MHKFVWRALLTIAWLMVPQPADAQFGAGADVVVRSRYVWRGITRTTKPVVQPSALVAWLPRGWTITTGVWASVEPIRPGAADLTGAGTDGGTGEVDYWIEAHTRVRRFDVRAGHIRYDLRHEQTVVGPGSGIETGEVYTGVLFLPGRLTGFGATLYWDYDVVDGVFATVDGFQHVPLVQAGNWIITLTPRIEAGVSMGQAIDPETGAPGYFVDNGLAYVSGTTAIFANEQRWSLHVSTSLQYNHDEATRVNRLDGNKRKTKAWIDAGVSYAIGSRPRTR